MDKNSNSTDNRLWKSLKEFNNEEDVLEFKHNEFIKGVTDEFDSSKLSGISRRKFFALLSASAALTATACTNYRDKGEIIPYNKRPEEVLPGEANYYASTCTGCSLSCGILIKTREGRPIKVDGNPDHPVSKGKICAKGQASIMDLYNPERLKAPKLNGSEINWKNADSSIIDLLNETQSNGKQIAVVTDTIVSPTAKKVLNEFASKYSYAKVYTYSLVNDNIRRQAWLESYGTDEYPAIKFDEADIILSLDSDFLANEGNFIENMRKYAVKRETTGRLNFNRLYVAEGRMSATGMMADYRLKVAPSQQLNFVLGIIYELSKSGSIQVDNILLDRLKNYSLLDKTDGEKYKYLIKDLSENKGKCIIYAGDTLSKEVHIAVNYLNEILDSTYLYDHNSSFKNIVKYSTKEDIQTLVDSMNNGSVGVVIHYDTNPVYSLPKDYGYGSALKNVKTVISLAVLEDETSSRSNYVLPINHTFEAWGDAYAREGFYSLQQPVIAPIFNTRQKEEILLTWTGNTYNNDMYHQYLMNSFNADIFSTANTLADSRTFWYSALHDGIARKNYSKQTAQFLKSSLNSIKEVDPNSGFVVQLTESYFIGDGRFSNNGWLQELPHPVSKVTWDNYASISPKTAKQLNVEMNDLVEVSAAGRILTLPVLIQPGVQENTINIELGYGRTKAGEVGNNVGFNSVELISKNWINSPLVIENASIKKAGGNHKLVSTQEHHSLDDTFVKDFHLSRKIIREGTVEKYKKEPYFLHEEKEDLTSITNDVTYKGHKWAMAIDLNKCTGCSACISSCNVENNIAVVGKEQVERGREMQWLRIDRYYSGQPENPIVSNQPMLCQHCDNAPCENVCPVNATNHSPDGLNQMAYNRCVGTRYCSNNCPYKVRRYNFFNHRDNFSNAYYENDLTSLMYNPEVTVRSRGVMEKCSFCVQRIMEARSNAIRDGKELKGNDIVTACQQACPSNAITFGDANDPNSEVAKLRKHNLSYHVLEELNVRPNVTYIAKLRNTHSEEK